MKIVGLLLAAGSAKRFGSDKLLHPLQHGVPIAVQAARHLRTEIPKVVAALRPRSEKLTDLLRAEGCEVTICENADEGMGASLACAVRAAGAAEGYLVALADMPFVRPSSIAAVRDALAGGAMIAAPYFRTRRGSGQRRFFDELSRLAATGARNIFGPRRSRQSPVGDPGVIRDTTSRAICPADRRLTIIALVKSARFPRTMFASVLKNRPRSNWTQETRRQEEYTS